MPAEQTGSGTARERIAAALGSTGLGPKMPAFIRRWKRSLLHEPPRVADQAEAHWDTQPHETAIQWLEIPAVIQYVNSRVTTVPWLYPLVAFKILVAEYPLRRGISIGCGTGNLERAVHRFRICEEITGIDISRVSLRKAREVARKENLRGIRYERGDFNELRLPENAYDAAFFHGSLHHVGDPDRLLGEIHKSLRPGAWLYVDEYIGPSRDEWTPSHLAEAQREYDLLDDALKLWPLNPPIAPGDPSEMVRSSRIRGAIEKRFEISAFRPYWGNLLFPLLCVLDGRKLLDPANEPLVRRFIDRETALVENGTFTDPLFAVIVARKR